tara:strand:- start:56 stop:247 length:192 start_codon:yes stop_codon:yes gene_type:complete
MNLKNTIRKILIFANTFLFGLGSFLCFIIAVTESKDRFLVSGIFLLLFAFVNNKIINLLVEKL